MTDKIKEELKNINDNAYAHGCSSETGHLGMDAFKAGALWYRARKRKNIINALTKIFDPYDSDELTNIQFILDDSGLGHLTEYEYKTIINGSFK